MVQVKPRYNKLTEVVSIPIGGGFLFKEVLYLRINIGSITSRYYLDLAAAELKDFDDDILVEPVELGVEII